MQMPRVLELGFAFERLDAWNRPVYCLGWRFNDDQLEGWSRRFNQFKHEEEQAVRAACQIAPRVLDGLAKKTTQPVSLVCACGHDKMRAELASAEGRLARAIGAEHGWLFEPDVLAHAPHAALSSTKGSDNREQILEGAYRAVRAPTNQRVLIVDDFATRGSTMAAIAAAILAVRNDALIMGFALAKTERQAWAQTCGQQLNNDHLATILGEWDQA